MFEYIRCRGGTLTKSVPVHCVTMYDGIPHYAPPCHGIRCNCMVCSMLGSAIPVLSGHGA
eukprot:6606050-Pyramimonas_sp.AAC.1